MARVHKFAQKKYQIESEKIALYGTTRPDFTYNDEPVMGQGDGKIIDMTVMPFEDTEPEERGMIITLTDEPEGRTAFVQLVAATADTPGGLSANTQSIGGIKVFADRPTFQSGIYVMGGASFLDQVELEESAPLLVQSSVTVPPLYTSLVTPTENARKVVVGSGGVLSCVQNTSYSGSLSVVAAAIPTEVGSLLTPTWDAVTPTNPIVTYNNTAPQPTINLLHRGYYTFYPSFHITPTPGTTITRVFLQFTQGAARNTLAPFASTSVYVGPAVTGVETVCSGSVISFFKSSADGVPHYLAMRVLAGPGDALSLTTLGGLAFTFTPSE